MHDACPDTMHTTPDVEPIHFPKVEPIPRHDTNAIELARIVGARARDIRLAKGLSLQTMYQRGAPTPSMLSLIERGHVNVKIETLQTVAKALDVLVAQFFYGPADEHDDALHVAANIDASTAKRLLFVGINQWTGEGTGMESEGGEGIV